MKRTLFLAVLCVFFCYSEGDACSKITNEFGKIGFFTARTMDFCAPLDSSLVSYPRGRSGDGGVKDGGKSLEWRSKYGFVGNAFFRKDGNFLGGGKIIAEGVNEKGLAVHLLFLNGAEFPARDKAKPGVTVFVWPEYVLGNFARVKDVVKDLKRYQMVSFATKVNGKDFVWPVHFALEDAGGDMAIIEPIKGELKVYHGRKYAVMTNEPDLEKQMANLEKAKKEDLFSNISLPGGADSMNRFVRLSLYNKEAPVVSSNKEAISMMFSAISGVYVPYFRDYQKLCDFASITGDVDDAWPTIASTVVDHRGKVFYFNDMNVGNRVWVDLKKLDFTQGRPVTSVTPSDGGLAGDVTSFMRE